MTSKKWTREETILAFDLYCKIPFNRVISSHPEIIKYAELMDRSVNSVKMKIGNFGSFDPELKKRGIVGLANTSKLDEEIWNEFSSDLGKLAEQSHYLLNKYAEAANKTVIEEFPEENKEGLERTALIKQRINQSFFRKVVLASYNYRCCITGLEVPELLVASHIVPWSKNKESRMDAHNGLCLNALHDKAFDRGLITITPEYVLRISSELLETNKENKLHNFLCSFQNKPILLPERFLPKPEFLQYHQELIFKG